VAGLAHKFLSKHGTSLSDEIRLSSRDLCELYAKIRIDIQMYRAKKGAALQRKLLGTEARGMLNNPFRETAYFVNVHHRKHFEKLFPAVWRALGGEQVDGAALRSALDQVRTIAPTTWRSLQEVGIL
jgi:hypothetical protein